jgi:iron complex outermembrane receptor protein
VQCGAGSFGTRKASVQFNSGLVNGTYAFQGRYSRLLSDGYRRDAWVDLTSYHWSAARYDPRMSTRIHVYGGPIADGLAYYGVPLEATRDRAARRDNALAGGSQIENFSQPHYEVLHDWRITDHTRLANTAFFVQGDGFFDFDGSFADTTYYRLTSAYGFHPVRNPGQSLIRAFVRNRQGGYLPRFEWQHAHGDLSVGGEVRVHRSEHWGKIRFAESLPDSVPDGAGGNRYQPYDPERKYYRYRGGKVVLGAFAHEVWRLGTHVQASGDLQLTHNRYRIYDEAFAGTDLTQDYFFANPRLGANINFNSAWHGYGSYGYVQREPRLKNLYDAAESSGGATPQYAVAAGRNFDFTRPLVHPEKLHDFELGGGVRLGERVTADVNVYWMDFRDEIVSNGQLDRFGQPVTGNARRSVHRGLEFAAAARPYTCLQLDANASWSRNVFRAHRVFVDAGGTPLAAAVQLGGNEIAGFPRFISNLRGTVRTHGAMAALAGRYVGGFFTTNFENPNQYVTPHFVLDADAAYEFRLVRGQPVRLHLQVRNLLDRLYVLQGQGDEYFPAATRNAFLGLEFGL